MTEFFRSNRVFLLLMLVWLAAGLALVCCTDAFRLHVQLNAFHTNFGDSIVEPLTWLATGWAIIIVVIAMLFMNFRIAVLTALAGIFSGLAAQLLKRFVFGSVMRPSAYFDIMPDLNLVQGLNFHSHFSFPSGHATTAFVLMFCISMLSRKHIVKIICFVLALLLSFTRIYLSQHFFEDILAGSALGVVVVIICALFFHRIIPLSWNRSIISLCSKPL